MAGSCKMIRGLLVVVSVSAVMLATDCRCVPHTPPSCDSGELVLPEDVVAASEIIGIEESSERFTDRWENDSKRLSLQIELVQDQFEQTVEFVPVRVTITNRTEDPIIFLRPQRISFAGENLSPGALIVELISPSGARIAPQVTVPGLSPVAHPDLTTAAFSRLAAAGSCAMDFQVPVWRVREYERIAPGNYQMSVVLQGWYIGPTLRLETEPYRARIDVGAWVGITAPSNTVAFTVSP